MNALNGLTSQPTQTASVTLPDGSRVSLTLAWRPQQAGWFYDLTWPGSDAFPTGFESLGRRLVTSANLLRQFRNLIPFGLAVFTADGADPGTVDALADGTATVCLLNSDDVAALEASVYSPP